MKKISIAVFIAMSFLLPLCKSQSSQTTSKGDVVDCNYYWPARSRYVCIKDMPRKECEELFAAGGFNREKTCVCDNGGKQKNIVEGTGYTQYDCK